MPASRGRIFNASLLSQATQASPGQSRLWRGQFRLRRTKRAAWIGNAEGCRLGKALQEVMRRRSPAEVMLALARQEAERKKSQRITASGNFEEHNNSSFWT